MSSLRFHSAAALTLVLASAVSAQAQTESPLIAGKAPLSLALTITETIGGYKLTQAQDDALRAKFVTSDGLMNPHDFDGETAGYNYFSERMTEVNKKLADGEIYTVEHISQVSKIQYLRKYANADFLKDLIVRGVLSGAHTTDKELAASLKGYGLVSVTFKGFDEDRRFYFAEKKNQAPVFLGWEKRPYESASLSSGLYLYTEVVPGAAETEAKKTSQKVTFETTKDSFGVTVMEALVQPDPTMTDKISGKAVLNFRLFPNGAEAFRDFRVTGKVTSSSAYTYSKVYKTSVYVNGKAAGSGLIGSQFITYGQGETTEVQPEAVVEGSVTLGAEAILPTDADARAFWNALPESLRTSL